MLAGRVVGQAADTAAVAVGATGRAFGAAHPADVEARAVRGCTPKGTAPGFAAPVALQGTSRSGAARQPRLVSVPVLPLPTAATCSTEIEPKFASGAARQANRTQL